MTAPGTSVTVRMRTSPEVHASGGIISAVTGAGAIITGLDVVDPGHEDVVLDISCLVDGADGGDRLRDVLEELPGSTVVNVSDSTFLIHLGGKLEVAPKVAIRNRVELARAYTPGVARICLAIAEHPSEARNLTIKRNTVAVVTDGSAVLGLGNLGPLAALPVMEGKAALFKRFADVDAWPICLDTQDTEEIIRAVELMAPGFGGINLEDISAPRCFEIERRLREKLDIPVMHDDQHGTAVVVLAALMNASRLVGKALSDLRVVLVGAGAAGAAIAYLLLEAGLRDIIVFDSKGAVYEGRANLDPDRQLLASRTNPRNHRGSVPAALAGADAFIGVSRPGVIDAEDIAAMAPDPIVFALSNPTPEIDPVTAARYATVVATGRSDYPNQINNVLAFPGIFRGMLDCGAHAITNRVLLAAAEAIASQVGPKALSPGYIIPSVFDPAVAAAVAHAVAEAAVAAD